MSAYDSSPAAFVMLCTNIWSIHQWHSQGLSWEYNLPNPRTKLRKKLKENWEKIKDNIKRMRKMRKLSSLVYPGLKVWLCLFKICAVYWAKTTLQRRSWSGNNMNNNCQIKAQTAKADFSKGEWLWDFIILNVINHLFKYFVYIISKRKWGWGRG